MYDQQTADLIRENERMRAALLAIKDYVEQCTFGMWRGHVHNMALRGLAKPKQ